MDLDYRQSGKPNKIHYSRSQREMFFRPILLISIFCLSALADPLPIEQEDISALMTEDGAKKAWLFLDFREKFDFKSDRYGAWDADGSKPYIKFQNGKIVKAGAVSDPNKPFCMLIKITSSNPDQTSADQNEKFSGVSPRFVKKDSTKVSAKGDPEPAARLTYLFNGYAGNGMQVVCETARNVTKLTLPDMKQVFGEKMSLTLMKIAIGPTNHDILWESKPGASSSPNENPTPPPGSVP